MELALEPELYAPIVNDEGKYTDQITRFPTAGLRCGCTSRNTVYDKRQSFICHIKTKSHLKWLETMNTNRANYYVECEKLNTLVCEQRKIMAGMGTEIANLEKRLLDANNTIDYLTKIRMSSSMLSSKKID